ncbi:MAG: D-alanine--D-alanine ligase [Phycisphaerales bacterium]|nr:MAG: D-alanine--D-alanine ligase [Phycisphaerales bacterium]
MGQTGLETANEELKVAVLFGGIGTERDVSIQSGTCVAEALEQAGFRVVRADIRPDNLEILDDSSIDVFFPALHGTFGEDGRLQQKLEDKSLLYTGSGPAASRLAFDKMASKELFERAGVATPGAIELSAGSDLRQLEEQLRHFGPEYVIKPIKQGSSVGISIVSTPGEALAAAQQTLAEFGDCMIEQFIPGREVTVGILCGRALPVIEIRTKGTFYDYHAKYVDEQTEFLFGTIEEPVAAAISQAALNCFGALGCRHFARVDSILSDGGVAYALEVNTIPGFTSHSLLPKAAARTGLSMGDLCSKIIEAACSSLARR